VGVGTTGRLTDKASEGMTFRGAGFRVGAGAAHLAATAAGEGGAELRKAADHAAVFSR